MAPYSYNEDDMGLPYPLLATIGTMAWSLRLLYQLDHNRRRRAVIDLGNGVPKQAMIGLLTVSWFGFGVFSQMPTGMTAILMDYPRALAVQGHLHTFVAFLLLGQMLRYELGMSRGSALMLLAFVMSFVALFESTYLIHMLRASFPIKEAAVRGLTTMGILFVGLGWLPLLIESSKHQGRSVSIEDYTMVGSLFGIGASMAALPTKSPFYYEGMILFGTMLFLECILLFWHLIWLLQTRKVRGEARHIGMSFDEFIADLEKNGISSPWAASRKQTSSVETTSSGMAPVLPTTSPLRRPGNVHTPAGR